ncbi:MAG: extracellular solute-binding protein [Aristaeellaceae bacterium]
MKINKMLALVMVLVFCCAACMTATADEKIQIQFLNGLTGGDGAYMRKITDGFNASQDKYEVIESQEKDHLTKFKANGADLTIMGDSDLYTYVVDGLVQEVSAVYDAAGVKMDDFIESAQIAVQVNDGTYGFPLDIHPLTMFYNKALISEDEVPTCYEDLVELNKKFQAQDPSLYVMAIPGSGLPELYWYSAAMQYGLELAEDGACNFNQEKLIDIFMMYHDMVFVDNLSPANLGLDAEFTSFAKTANDITTQAALAMTGVWFYGAASEIYGENLGIAKIPVFGDEFATCGGAHVICVSSEVTDAAKLEGIAAFFNYLYQPENLLNWADSGQTPVHKATMDVIRANPEKWPVAAVNVDAVTASKPNPKVYNSGTQMGYVNNNIWPLVVSDPDLTREELADLFAQATKNARQIADEE